MRKPYYDKFPDIEVPQHHPACVGYDRIVEAVGKAISDKNQARKLIAIGPVDKWGRKPLMLIGSAGIGLSLVGIGLAACFNTVGLWLLVFMLSYVACFSMSVGPLTWIILSEIFPTKIRSRDVAICVFFLWVSNFIVSHTFPMWTKAHGWWRSSIMGSISSSTHHSAWFHYCLLETHAGNK